MSTANLHRISKRKNTFNEQLHYQPSNISIRYIIYSHWYNIIFSDSRLLAAFMSSGQFRHGQVDRGVPAVRNDQVPVAPQIVAQIEQLRLDAQASQMSDSQAIHKMKRNQ
jgi:hypothetical protein